MSELQRSLIRALLYFDIFSYPLTHAELTQCCNYPEAEADSVQQALTAMVDSGYLGCREGFYFVGEEKGKIERRRKGNQIARDRMPKALKVSRFIGKFPFVRAVMLSGSLSKNYMEGDSDIDYFIVTQPGRLWISRTFLILYKKIFLLNSHKNFCVNYFVDTEHLEIEDKNIFTATEVAFLLPSYNYSMYRDFRSSNHWAEHYYPNYGLRRDYPCPEALPSWRRSFVEWMLKGKMGEKLDSMFMRRTLKRWRTKFPDFDQESFEVALRSRKYVSKHHPRKFQEVVTVKLREKQLAFEQQFDLELGSARQ